MPKIAAVSDLHFHNYTNGLTLDDVIKVGDEFIELCKSNNAEMIIFAGDITLSRNPMYEVTLAIINFLKKLGTLGIPVAYLVGNHDRVYKSDFRLHSLNHVKSYPDDYPNITIMDQRRAYQFHLGDRDVVIHAVPAGHKPEDFDVYPNVTNICVFHDMIIGSLMASGIPAETGLSVTSFDKKGFDLVLAGDNHRRQALKGLTDCQGIYLGAGLQHNWGDEGDIRGFTIIDISKQFELSFIPSHSPKFIKVSWGITSLDELIEHIRQIDGWENNIVKLNIIGPSKIVLDIDTESLKNKMIKHSNTRLLDVKYDYTDEAVTPTTEPKNDNEEWVAFLDTKVNSLENVDIEYLKKLGMEYIDGIQNLDS